MTKTKLNRKNKANNNASGEAPLVSSVEPPIAGVVQRKIKKKDHGGAASKRVAEASTPMIVRNKRDSSSVEESDSRINDYDPVPSEEGQIRDENDFESEIDNDFNDSEETYDSETSDLQNGKNFKKFSKIRHFNRKKSLSSTYESLNERSVEDKRMKGFLLQQTCTTDVAYCNTAVTTKVRVKRVVEMLGEMRFRGISIRDFFPNADVPSQFFPSARDSKVLFMQKLLLGKYLFFLRDSPNSYLARLKLLATKNVSTILDCIQSVYNLLVETYADVKEKGVSYFIPPPHKLVGPLVYPRSMGNYKLGDSESDEEINANRYYDEGDDPADVNPPKANAYVAPGSNISMSGVKMSGVNISMSGVNFEE